MKEQSAEAQSLARTSRALGLSGPGRPGADIGRETRPTIEADS